MNPLNPADYPTYNVGDQVTIRQWDDMKSEFGLNEAGSITVPESFTREMERYCGKTFTICAGIGKGAMASPSIGSPATAIITPPPCLSNPNSNSFRPLLFPLMTFSKVVIDSHVYFFPFLQHR